MEGRLIQGAGCLFSSKKFDHALLLSPYLFVTKIVGYLFLQTLPGTSVSCQVRTSVPPSLTSLPSSSEISAPLCPRQGDAVNRLNGCGNDFGVSAASGLQRDAVHADNPVCFPERFSNSFFLFYFSYGIFST